MDFELSGLGSQEEDDSRERKVCNCHGVKKSISWSFFSELGRKSPCFAKLGFYTVAENKAIRCRLRMYERAWKPPRHSGYSERVACTNVDTCETGTVPLEVSIRAQRKPRSRHFLTEMRKIGKLQLR